MLCCCGRSVPVQLPVMSAEPLASFGLVLPPGSISFPELDLDGLDNSTRVRCGTCVTLSRQLRDRATQEQQPPPESSLLLLCPLVFLRRARQAGEVLCCSAACCVEAARNQRLRVAVFSLAAASCFCSSVFRAIAYSFIHLGGSLLWLALMPFSGFLCPPTTLFMLTQGFVVASR